MDEELIYVEQEKLVPGTCLVHPNGFNRAVITQGEAKGKKVMLLTHLHSYHTEKLSRNRYEKLRDEGWLVMSSFVTDFVCGSIGGWQMCILRDGMMYGDKLTKSIVELLEVEGREGDKIVSIVDSGIEELLRSGFPKQRHYTVEYQYKDGTWVHQRLL